MFVAPYTAKQRTCLFVTIKCMEHCLWNNAKYGKCRKYHKYDCFHLPFLLVLCCGCVCFCRRTRFGCAQIRNQMHFSAGYFVTIRATLYVAPCTPNVIGSRMVLLHIQHATPLCGNNCSFIFIRMDSIQQIERAATTK